MPRGWLALALALLAALAGCRPAPQPRSDETRPLAVTSATVLADLIRQVGGERVEVHALVPSGADPLTYQPAPRDVVVVSRARIVFFNGLGLDRTVRSVVANAARPELPLVTLSDGLPTLESELSDLDRTLDGTRRGHPYLWLDPRLAIRYVEKIRDGLVAVDPAGAQVYRERAASYSASLLSLDAEVESTLAGIPAARRKLVTMQDAFPYFAERYGLQLIAAVIRTPGREPAAQEVAEVARAMQEQGIQTVFTQPQLNARLLKLAARDAGLQISTLYSDTLDQTVPTYADLLRYNARHLVNGLR